MGAVRPLLGGLATRLAAGTLLGLLVTLWLSRFMGLLLYDITPHDPLAIATATIALVTVSAGAGLLPAYRASRLDPARVLERN